MFTVVSAWKFLTIERAAQVTLRFQDTTFTLIVVNGEVSSVQCIQPFCLSVLNEACEKAKELAANL